jgi:hypothetical protein
VTLTNYPVGWGTEPCDLAYCGRQLNSPGVIGFNNPLTTPRDPTWTDHSGRGFFLPLASTLFRASQEAARAPFSAQLEPGRYPGLVTGCGPVATASRPNPGPSLMRQTACPTLTNAAGTVERLAAEEKTR